MDAGGAKVLLVLVQLSCSVFPGCERKPKVHSDNMGHGAGYGEYGTNIYEHRPVFNIEYPTINDPKR